MSLNDKKDDIAMLQVLCGIHGLNMELSKFAQIFAVQIRRLKYSSLYG